MIPGACLLGKDLANLASDSTYGALLLILERDYERLGLEMVRSIREAEEAQKQVEIRLSRFKAGMLMRQG
jgi:predicted nucleotidyltransferase